MNKIELTDTLVITEPCKIRDTIFTATSPTMLGKPMISMPSLELYQRLQGISFKRVTLNCNGIASGIAAADLEGGLFEDIAINSPLSVGMYLAGQKNSMQGVTVRRLRMWCQSSEYGLILAGQFEPNSNVSFSTFEQVYIKIGGTGRGVEVRDGDNCLFNNVLVECDSSEQWALNCIERGNNAFINFDPTHGKVNPGAGNHFLAWSTLNGGASPS